MIKIRPADSRKNEKARIKRGHDTAGVSKSGSAFSSQLVRVVADDFQGTMDALLDELGHQEKRFLDSQSLYELARYKGLVQKILRHITEEGFTIKSMKPTRRHGLELRIVQDIDARLLEIKNAITTSNRAFDLMKSIEEIRGLILDFIS
jgi:uncharacterized protein YaaR (DUF327 family)